MLKENIRENSYNATKTIIKKRLATEKSDDEGEKILSMVKLNNIPILVVFPF